MTCEKAQSLITPFIHDKLNIKDTEEFIDHIANCPDCREELEVCYVMLTAMKQLDEDRKLSDDYSRDLQEKLERAQEKVVHVKYTYFRKKGILILIIILLAIFISMRYAYMQIENPDIQSDFKLRYMFQEDRYDIYDKELQQYFNQQNTE